MMIRHDKEKNVLYIDDDEYRCDDEIDMHIFARRIAHRLKIQKAVEKPSITWNDIVDSTDWVEDDLVNAPIFACTWAGDIYGFDILGADYKSIILVQNDYYRSGI